jgi:hypothetical protein
MRDENAPVRMPGWLQHGPGGAGRRSELGRNGTEEDR